MIDFARLDRDRYRIEVSDADLIDLRARLEATRWPIEPAGARWQYGTDLAYLRTLVDHWRDRYDWRADEARFNRFRQFRVPVDGLRLHMIVEPGSGPAPSPLVLLNGWPSSFVEFADVIEPLAHPERFGGDAADAFTVIAPSLPGFGFSDPPAAPIGARAAAVLVRALIDRIVGPERYVVQGSDWGAIVGSWMAFDAPERMLALHLNSAPLRSNTDGIERDAEVRDFMGERARRLAGETGYQAIQSTKPQTLSYGLTDSPAGLAGWIVEKFQGWVVPGNGAPPPFPLDRLIANIMIYWLNGINAANWLYRDLVDGGAVTLPRGGRIDVPTALFAGGRDLVPPPPPQWVRRSYDLVDYASHPGMGHFPWMEPAAAVQLDHLRAFVRTVRAGRAAPT